MNRFFRSALFPLIVIVLLVYLASQTLIPKSKSAKKVTTSDVIARIQTHGVIELPARVGSDEDVDARPHQIASQSPLAVDEIRDVFGRQHRPSVDEHQVQPNTKRRQTTRTCQRVVDSSAAHHQACRGEDARCVRELDAFVDLRRQAEIVGRDDQRLQCATSRRSRRK